MGFWEYFKNAIFIVLDWLYRVCGDWGIAIILITIIFRVLISPITLKQSRSAYQMQKLQPKLKEIQDKYSGNPRRVQEEQSKLYAEANVNPFSGCLPTLLQMPLFAVLLNVLRDLDSRIISAGHAESVLPARLYNLIPDLSLNASGVFSFTAEGLMAALPYFITLVLFGASMALPMLINPVTDKSTRMTTLFMAGMMLLVGWNTPAGVLLYWDTSSLIGIGQQILVKRNAQQREARESNETIDIKPVVVDVERRERRNRPRKSK